MTGQPPMLQLDIVGAGPAYTDRVGASGAAYLVRHGSSAVLLDLGQGSFPRLASLLEPSALEAVVVSHLHPDHFIDLVALRHYLRWQFHPSRRVRVIAPGSLAERLDALHAEPGFAAATLAIEELLPGTIRIGELELAAARVTHTENSYGFRIAESDGAGLVYSGDCGRAEDLDPLVRPGDTILTEVSFGPGPVPSDADHLDGPAVGALATRTRAGAVLLTHLQMGFDEHATIESVRAAGFDGPVTLVEPGDQFVLDRSGTVDRR
jgi:ribonuclease BN (tRNA processing enzyme)